MRPSLGGMLQNGATITAPIAHKRMVAMRLKKTARPLMLLITFRLRYGCKRFAVILRISAYRL